MKKKPQSVIDIYLAWPLAVIAILLLGDVVLWLTEPRGALILLPFILIATAFALLLYFTRQSKLQGALQAYAIGASEVHTTIFDEMPMPYCMVDERGNVLWANRSFREIAGNRPDARNILQMFPNIHKEMLEEDDVILEIHSDYQDRKYLIDLMRTPVTTEDGSAPSMYTPDLKTIAVYLRDETEETVLRTQLDQEHIVIGLVYIDNYDEVREQIEEVRRSLLTALIDRKISHYISSVNGLIYKLEKDKYVFILKEQYFNRMLQDRFSILEEVKNVNIGNEMAVTLSIGIGYGADSYQKNYEYAHTSIDMALGRGGDQAVVKSNENLTYFGGKTQTQEKATRVKARVKAQAFQELLETRDRVLVMGHANSDVDCLGASAGVYRMVTELGKRCYIVENTVTAPILPLKERFLQSSDYPEDMFITGAQALQMVDNSTVLVVVDCNRPSIIDEPELLRACKTIVVFDHHRQSSETIQGAVLSYCEPYASSACEMIAEMMQYIADGIKVKGPEADAMYGGIVIDSQEFTVQTGVRTFEAAAYLRRCGADITRIRKIFRENFKDYQAKAAAISSAEIYRDAYAFSTIDPKGLESPTVVCAQAANELLNIRGIKASIVLTLYNDIIYVSARSIDEMNVQVLMEKLGGGGHRTIAGAQLREGSLPEAIATIKQAIDEMIKEGEAS
ncbi:MAG: DHH family phosphoesterase [Lachnospiraceae bacterium]|nr:DHH family phosphoesterase [Lachnospiraceae bacterium]